MRQAFLLMLLILFARFDVKKNTRTLTGASVNLFYSSVGVSSADDLNITVTETRPKVFDTIVIGKPGEYCFTFTDNGTMGFGGVYNRVMQFFSKSNSRTYN